MAGLEDFDSTNSSSVFNMTGLLEDVSSGLEEHDDDGSSGQSDPVPSGGELFAIADGEGGLEQLPPLDLANIDFGGLGLGDFDLDLGPDPNLVGGGGGDGGGGGGRDLSNTNLFEIDGDIDFGAML